MTSVLTQFASDQQRHFDSLTSPTERKERGHFGTPSVIADFMVGMFPKIPNGTVRILDPGAGVGTLSAALCQRIVRQKSPRHVELELWENDSSLTPILWKTMSHCQSELQACGHCLDFVIHSGDFILENARRTLFDDGVAPSFDLAILNPPYFKLRKDSPQAQAMSHVVHGQPNIYALFMAVTVDLLRDDGEMVAITPRSYFNGAYFKRFRKWFFDRMTAQQIHVFESRTAAFQDDAVLQENVIIRAKKTRIEKNVQLTSTSGRDVGEVT